MKRQEVADRLRAAYAAFASDDQAAYRAVLADGITWHVPGDNPVSGIYHGAEYFNTMPQRMAPLDLWDIDVVDIFVNERDRTGLVRFRLVGERRDQRIDMGGYHVVRLDEAGRIIEGWGFADDQDEMDAFFAA